MTTTTWTILLFNNSSRTRSVYRLGETQIPVYRELSTRRRESKTVAQA